MSSRMRSDEGVRFFVQHGIKLSRSNILFFERFLANALYLSASTGRNAICESAEGASEKN